MNFMGHLLSAIRIMHKIRCRGCGQEWAGEELDIAGIRITREDTPCGCTCTDPAAPHYEDWVVDA